MRLLLFVFMAMNCGLILGGDDKEELKGAKNMESQSLTT